MTVMMSDEVYEKIHNFLSVIANDDNWKNDKRCGWENFSKDNQMSLEWTKKSYDPQYVAQDLLEEIYFD